MFSYIEDIIESVKRGEMVIVVDDEARENEGDLVVSAQFVTPEVINFMIKEGRGLVCAPLDSQRIRELNLEQMHHQGGADPFKTAWRVT